jgi:hypothetical protein
MAIEIVVAKTQPDSCRLSAPDLEQLLFNLPAPQPGNLGKEHREAARSREPDQPGRRFM